MSKLKENAVVYCEGAFHTPNGKTAHGLVRFTERYHIRAVIDSRYKGSDAGMVLDGRPIVARTLMAFDSCAVLDRIVLVVPAAHRAPDSLGMGHVLRIHQKEVKISVRLMPKMSR